MHYSAIKPVDIADGPGVRVGLYVSGCNIHCPGCHNQSAWSFDSGQPFTGDTMDYLLNLLKPDYIAGLSILGGEPMANQNVSTVRSIIARVRRELPGKTIWLYTGYEWDRIRGSPAVQMCDVVVDGPFIHQMRDLSLRFRGSSNQRIIDVPASMKENKIIVWDERE